MSWWKRDDQKFICNQLQVNLQTMQDSDSYQDWHELILISLPLNLKLIRKRNVLLPFIIKSVGSYFPVFYTLDYVPNSLMSIKLNEIFIRNKKVNKSIPAVLGARQHLCRCLNYRKKFQIVCH